MIEPISKLISINNLSDVESALTSHLSLGMSRASVKTYTLGPIPVITCNTG